MIIVKKLKISIIEENEEVRKEKYKFIRDSQYAQYRGLNIAMGILTSAYLESVFDLKSDIFKNASKSIRPANELFKDITFGRGVETFGSIYMKVTKDFSTSLKNGLARGERSFTNYKRDFPLIVTGRRLKFSYDEKGNVIIKWVNKISFKVIAGSSNERNSSLNNTLNKIVNNDYAVKKSHLLFEDNKLMLHLTLDIPVNIKDDFIKDRTLGVDLGIKYPAYACLSDNTYIRQSFGTAEEFIKVRSQMRDRRRRVQSALQNVKGGRGRKDKLRALESLKGKEKNFATTYNHAISSRVVKFAKDNQCEFIKLEKLNSKGLDNNLLGKWSYFQLQTYIEYKAEREGIKVFYIDPAYTSQTCSKCGCIDKGNRTTQTNFECVECGFKLNADHNAAINIARSNKIVKKEEN